MNIIALISALIGIIFVIIVFIIGNKIKNRWLRYLSVLIGILIAFVGMGYTPVLFGVKDHQTAADAGGYFFYLGILTLIIKGIFFRKKKPENHGT